MEDLQHETPSRLLTFGLVTPRYAPAIGGVERHVEALACGLVQRGFRVEVVTTDPTGRLAPIEERDGVLVRRFTTVANDAVYFVAPQLGFWLWRNAARFSLIHAHSYHTPLAFQAALASRRMRVPLVVTPHYHGTGHSPLRRLLHAPYRLPGAWLLRQARRVICVSEVERVLLMRHFNLRAVDVAPNGIELDELLMAQPRAKAAEQKLILAVGRLEHYKHVDRLIMAVPSMPAEYQVVIVGTGPARPHLEQLAQQLGVADRVQFAGQVARADLLALYRTADVFVTLSQHEAFGLTLLESVVGGAAVVASSIPAHQEVASYLPAERVLFVDHDCTATQLSGAIEQAVRRGRMHGVTGWSLPTWDGMVAAIVTCYQATLGAAWRAFEATA
jgi:glycosyltransferase involved in cell wall biosynthesis